MSFPFLTSSSTFFTNALLFAGGLWCVYGLLLVIYRWFFHPLARFPGSKLAAATKWFEFYYDVIKSPGGQYAWKVDRMHEKYGPIVRINPDEIHIKDSDFHRVLYAPGSRRDKYGPAAEMVGTPLASFGTVQHDLHRKRRLANSIFFSKRAITSSEQIIWQQVGLLCGNLHKQYVNDEAQDMHVVFSAYTADTLTRYIFGEPWGYQGNYEKAEDFRKNVIHAQAKSTPLVKQFPWLVQYMLKLPVAIVRPILPQLAGTLELQKRAQGLARDFLSNEAKQTEESTTAQKSHELPPSLFHAIARSTLIPEEKNFDRISQEVFTFVGAGVDTTSQALTHALYYLVLNPPILKRLKEELSTVMPSSTSKPKLKMLEELPFFTAVIKESLRNMALFTSRFPLMAPEPLKYKDWIIPAKTPVSMTIRDVVLDASIYPLPTEFLPDRWLENGKIHNHLSPYWVPFGRGPRICQGMDFAWAEMYIALAAIIARFEFELYDTIHERDVKFVSDCFIGMPDKSSKGIRMRVVSDNAV